MKIAVIGDPHGSEKVRKIQLDKVDLILIVGDLGKADIRRKITFKKSENEKYIPSGKEIKKGFEETFETSIKILKHFSKFAPVYTIFGNIEKEDKIVKERSKKYKIKLPLLEREIKRLPNIHVINNKSIKIGKSKIGGLKYFIDSCWIKEFNSKDKEKIDLSKKESVVAKKALSKFKDLDILITHQPPYGVLDKVGDKAPKSWVGKKAGSKIILDYIKKHKPKYVFCGHIHEGKGMRKIGETTVYNVGCCGDHIIIDLS